MTVSKVHEGLNESNRLLYRDIGPASVADNASWTVQMAVGSGLPLVHAVYTYGAGAAGVRLATYFPVVDTGSALVGVEVVSFDEATGLLTLTNRSGGALVNPRTLFTMVSDAE